MSSQVCLLEGALWWKHQLKFVFSLESHFEQRINEQTHGGYRPNSSFMPIDEMISKQTVVRVERTHYMTLQRQIEKTSRLDACATDH